MESMDPGAGARTRASAEQALAAPRASLFGLAREASGFLELPQLLFRTPDLLTEPRGEGASVFVLPGFGADGRSTWPLRRYLAALGHDARDWGFGANRGAVPESVEAMGERVRDVARETGRPVALVGWSLGGYIAREVARDWPDETRRVVTFGSPVIGGPKYTTAAPFFATRGWDLDEIEAEVARRKEVPLRVPTTAIYSRNDGIVDWRACIDDEAGGPIEHVEVEATHLGLGFSADVFRLVARRLADA